MPQLWRMLLDSFTLITICRSCLWVTKVWKYQRVIRSLKSKKDRQHNDQKKRDKKTNNDLHNTTQKAISMRSLLTYNSLLKRWPLVLNLRRMSINETGEADSVDSVILSFVEHIDKNRTFWIIYQHIKYLNVRLKAL